MNRTILLTVFAIFVSITQVRESRAGLIFPTPAGIQPGQSFNVVFVDSLGDTATSTNIADYNAAITSAASGIQYQGGTNGSWSIIGATPTDDGAAALFTSNLPVYDLSGNLLASTGILYRATGPAPSIDQSGNLFFDYPVWTGLIALGIPAIPLYNLGGGPFPSYGLSSYPPPADGWGGLVGHSPTDTLFIYGYAVFTASSGTAVPEPSSIMLAFVGLVVSAAVRGARRRIAASRVS